MQEKITLEEFIRSKAPEGTSDEVIEKQVATVTRAVLRGLGKVGEKLKGIIGRVIQRFKGREGVWITQGGRKIFIPVKDAKAAAAATKRRRLSPIRRAEEAERRVKRIQEIRAAREDPITRAIKRDKAAANRFKANVRRNFSQNRRRTFALNRKMVDQGLIDPGPGGEAFARNIIDLAEDSILAVITGRGR